MSETSSIADAGRILAEALASRNMPGHQKAVQEILGLLAILQTTSPNALATAFEEDPAVTNPCDGPEERLIRSLVKDLSANFRSRWPLLFKVLLPRWTCGGEPMLSRCPPFGELRDELMRSLDCGIIDLEGFAAVLIGRFGPDAVEVLPELIERLRVHHRDCSKAPGLTWAVYAIGGMRTDVKAVLIEVANDERSCPHSRPLAIEILTLNQVDWKSPP